ncbi:MAG: FAD:protein FMN transferase [Oscillospiraceae bacterium]|jgi:thiamine biosynthesis lipoprotein|nr:FAD:protein FMN transferase [Oscillospiraceae bacterium]
MTTPRKLRTLRAAVLLLVGGFVCSSLSACSFTPTRYEATFDGLFDTYADVTVYADSRSSADKAIEFLHAELKTYDRQFDIYNNYPNSGANNLKTINDNAGIQPVEVSPTIIELLTFCKDMYTATNGAANAAMGSVLSLWHTAREYSSANSDNAYVPTTAELEAAAKLTDWDDIAIDSKSNTVFITKAGMSLDVGAIAKGWAAGRAVQNLKAADISGFHSLLLSFGGNVVPCGLPPNRESWVVGIQDPVVGIDEATRGIIETVSITNEAVVSSGDYQRYYTVDNTRYNHIIDPDTLFPATRYAQVTVLHPDSGVADALSTALFILDEENGKVLIDKFGAKAWYVYHSGEIVNV